MTDWPIILDFVPSTAKLERNFPSTEKSHRCRIRKLSLATIDTWSREKQNNRRNDAAAVPKHSILMEFSVCHFSQILFSLSFVQWQYILRTDLEIVGFCGVIYAEDGKHNIFGGIRQKIKSSGKDWCESQKPARKRNICRNQASVLAPGIEWGSSGWVGVDLFSS